MGIWDFWVLFEYSMVITHSKNGMVESMSMIVNVHVTSWTHKRHETTILPVVTIHLPAVGHQGRCQVTLASMRPSWHFQSKLRGHFLVVNFSKQ